MSGQTKRKQNTSIGKKLCAFKATEWQVLKHCLYTHAKLVPLDRKGKYGVLSIFLYCKSETGHVCILM